MNSKEDCTVASDPSEGAHTWTQSEMMLRLSKILDRVSTPTSSCMHILLPEKFNIGGDFSLWHKKTEIYIRNFPQDKQQDVILSLLDGEAFHLAVESNIFSTPVSSDTFNRLRQLVDTPKLPVEYRQELKQRCQLPGENVRVYARSLRELALRAFDPVNEEYIEKRVLEQFIDGVSLTSIKRKFHLHPPATLDAAITKAEQLEKLESAVDTPLRQCVVSNQCPVSHNSRRTPPRNNHELMARSPKHRRGSNKYSGTPRGAYRRTELPYSKSFVPAVSVVNSVFPLMISIIIGGIRTSALIDTGASRSLIIAKLSKRLLNTRSRNSTDRLMAANGSFLRTEGKVFTAVETSDQTLEHNFIVCSDLSFDCIFGLDLLRRLGSNLNLNTASVSSVMPCGSAAGCHIVNSIADGKHPTEISFNIPFNLKPPVRNQLETLLRSHREAFAWNDQNIGRTSIIKHEINTGDSPPIRVPPRRIPSALLPEVNALIDNMLKKGVIQPSTSPWSAPVVLVKKKNGDLRLCVDYRQLNQVTRRDAFPLPRIDDLFDALAGSKFFSTLDLASGYWQVEVEDRDRPKTAFTVPSGLYEFQTMPFGLVNAPATFQRVMQKTLQDLVPTACLVYLDDVIVLGKTVDEHLSNLEKVLCRLTEVGLTLQPKKCHFLCPEVNYLGHVVSSEGIRTDPTKISQVSCWPIPTNSEELQSFLGLASYYRRFIKGFAQISEPLIRLTRKDVAFRWDELCDQAFRSLKDKLCSAPILRFPDTSNRAVIIIIVSDSIH